MVFKILRFFAVSILIPALVSAVCLYVYHKRFAPRIAVVNIDRVIEEQRDLLLKGEITIDEAREKLDEITSRINSLPKNYIVMRKGAVIRGNVEEIEIED